MIDPEIAAFTAVADSMDASFVSGKKNQNQWKLEPVAVHLLKATGHSNSALHILCHPEAYKADKESYMQHIDQAITRLAMAKSKLGEQ